MVKSTRIRARYALQWAVGHLAISALVAAGAALLVFQVWYPSPWRQMLGVTGIFGLVVAVDLVCGPLLTLLLLSPEKSRRERWLDMSLIAFIQLAALSYGVYSVFVARPVVLAFEVDRFVIVTANEVQIEQLPTALPDWRSLPWWGINQVALRKAVNADEFLSSVEEATQGVTQAMRPGWWRPYAEAKSEIDIKAKPLTELIERRPAEAPELRVAAEKTALALEELRYLPLTSSKLNDWVVLLSDKMTIVGYAQVDGF